jgi:hypothetical protein
VDVDASAEGWYLDPYGVHEQRWISEGRPSNLVRDGDQESKDESSDRPPSHPYAPIPIDLAGSPGRSDLLRADDAEAQPIPKSSVYRNVAMEGSVVVGNAPLLAGPVPAGAPGSIEQPFERKLRHRVRRKCWKQRWNRWFGGVGSSLK